MDDSDYRDDYIDDYAEDCGVGGDFRQEILPVSGVLLLPETDVSFRMGQPGEAWRRKYEGSSCSFLAALLRDKREDEDISVDDFYPRGVFFKVNSIVEGEGGLVMVAHITQRAELYDIIKEGDSFYARSMILQDEEDLDESSREEMLHYLKKAVEEITQSFQGGEEFQRAVNAYTDLNSLMVYLSQFMPLSRDERYRLMDTDSKRERSLLFIDYLLRQRELLKLNIQMRERFSERANRAYREQALRAQLRAIQEELHEDDPQEEDRDDYRAKIEKADLPEEVKKVALEEAGKLERSGQEGMEQNVIRNYLDFILALPWKPQTAAPIDLAEARRILDEGHYGLQQVKERIIQHLAVMKLKDENKGSALLLVGPPGTGKTSLGKSIAQALGRKYIRMSLGGIRDEAEIRGHRRTYVGAMPGRILESIKRAGTMNPVLVLDEIDKLTPGGFSGDPSSALLEVLDPEQNFSFTDHYLDLPYDLSHVFFIATANSLDGIPAPLLDRMEMIEISGYTPDEKFHIGKEHLLAEVLADNGIPAGKLQVDDEILRKIIEEYTQEAGVRGLKKQLAALARASTEKIVTGQAEDVISIQEEDLEKILGHKVSRHETAQEDNPPGVVTGLAWTPVGGEILFIETTDMPGSGEIILTGQLGDVMKESARISISLLKSRLPFDTVNFGERDLHIHVPSGAVPKDGPSAGIALFTALASLVTGRKVDPHLAMTGEITLRGEVTPIGGLKEKLYGAQRAGIRKVLIPAENVQDLQDVPEEIKSSIQIVPVSNVEEVLQEALGITLPRIEHVLYQLPGEQGGLNAGLEKKAVSAAQAPVPGSGI